MGEKKHHPILFNIFKEDPYFSAILFRTVVFGFSCVDTFYMNRLQPGYIMYVTNWAQLMINFYYFLALVQAIFRIGTENFFTKFISIVFHMCLSFEFLVFVFYWPLLSYEDFERCLAYPEAW